MGLFPIHLPEKEVPNIRLKYIGTGIEAKSKKEPLFLVKIRAILPTLNTTAIEEDKPLI